MSTRVEVILVAGGLGRRMLQSIPKAFLALGGLPLFLHALRQFALLPEVKGIILVVPSGQEAHAEAVCQGEKNLRSLKKIISGGPRRQDSVRNGMDHIAQDTDLVLIHDGARPFCSGKLIREVIAAAENKGAALPGIPLVDTLKRVNEEAKIEQTIDRRNLIAVQTPQGFQRTVLFAAYQYAWEHQLTATDDAGLVELSGHPVFVVEGEPMNFKVTRPEDLELAEFWLQQRKKNGMSGKGEGAA